MRSSAPFPLDGDEAADRDIATVVGVMDAVGEALGCGDSYDARKSEQKVSKSSSFWPARGAMPSHV